MVNFFLIKIGGFFLSGYGKSSFCVCVVFGILWMNVSKMRNDELGSFIEDIYPHE